MLQPGTSIGRYVVEREIGQGGMAAVYRVRDDSGAPWALKLLTMRKTEVSDRFRLEAEIQVALDHPHIVRGREVIDVDGEPGLVMEFVDGAALDVWQAAHPLATLAEKDRLARQIVDAVAYAHAHGLVHRDLKPGNVMIEDRPDGPYAKVTDFGLAKVVDGIASTRTGVALGTPRYMAPEQIRDAKRVDARADVWSLGVLLYELYTGRAAFYRPVVMDVFTAVVNGDYVDPAQFGVPARIRDAIRGALQVDPAARFADCRALMVALGTEASPASGAWALPALGSPMVAERPIPVPPDPPAATGSFDVPGAFDPPRPSATLSPPSDPDPSGDVFPSVSKQVVRRPERPWPIRTWIAAWTGSLLLVFVLFAAGIIGIGLLLSLSGG